MQTSIAISYSIVDKISENHLPYCNLYYELILTAYISYKCLCYFGHYSIMYENWIRILHYISEELQTNIIVINIEGDANIANTCSVHGYVICVL